MRNAGACIVFAALVGACGVGDEGSGMPDTDDPNDVLGIICTAEYDVSGTWTAGTPMRDAETPTGCWPVGTWTFTATLRSNECSSEPTQLESQYSFRVDRMMNPDPEMDIGWEDTYTYLGNQAYLYRLKVSEGGGGDCEGGLELYSADNTEYWNLKPAIFDDSNVISGFAEYAKFKEPQR